jgi:hypothetical protein
MEFQVQLNPKNMLRDVIIGKGAGLFLEVIDPKKERFDPLKDEPAENIVFKLILGENSESPEGIRYITVRAQKHQTQKITEYDYLNAITHYCEVRDLKFNTFEPANLNTGFILEPGEEEDALNNALGVVELPQVALNQIKLETGGYVHR